MSTYVKELLIDLSMNRLPIELRFDLIVAVQQVINSGVFTRREIKYLDMFLQGYSAEEIAQRVITTTDVIESTLARIMTAIEHISGYTDSSLNRKIQMRGKYSRLRLLEFKDFLLKQEGVFTCT